MVKHAISLLAIVLAADGLWTHDWRLILAGAATALIWPLISADLEASKQHKAVLDRMWGDEAA